ncbi:MAG: TIGR04282 family arsenosugar biosynthesis glycosyltransferase [Candidatus Rokubacteria bacterium]|nr:TIGR04282 family arsenosugar biosynthesis glycosyltransferase [Candidatus Rokubacteria bacterium]
MSREGAPVAVLIMAKAPHPGEVKTRLCPPLSPVEAAELYRCFLLDKIEQVRTLRQARAAVAYTPAEGRGLFEELAPGFALLPQRGDDLGARLAGSFEQLLADGFAAALAIDSDTPTLPTAFLQEAVDLVASGGTDVVLGPTEDGGYYLIGLRQAHRELFEGIPWSTAEVLPETIRRARASGLTVRCLPPWFDVDTPADLERLQGSLAAADEGPAPRTRRFLLGRRTTEPAAKPWTTLSTTPVYRNKWISVREDLVELPDGRTTIYGVVTCPACVGVLPFLDRDTVLLVRQYRYVAGRRTWEMPTGGVHAGESIEAAAQRELSEEIGYRAGRLVHASTYHTSKSVMDETAHLFLGAAMTRLEAPPDDTEFIEVRPFPFEEALRMVVTGEITDSMTIIAVLHAARLRSGA